MHSAGRRFRLGVFVLGAAGLFVAMLAFLLHGSFEASKVGYFILFDQNVKGMVVGSKVNFQGVPIGAVKDIRFQDGRTLVEVLVDPTRANIQDITRARLDRLLVTGQVTVELEGYGRDGKSVPPGSFLQPKEDPLYALTGSLPEAMAQAVTTLRQLEATLARAEHLLGDANQGQVRAILANLEAGTRQFAEHTAPALTGLLTELRTTNAAYAGLPAAVQDHLADLAPELAATLREVQALAGGLRGPVQSTLSTLRLALDDVRGFARQLRLAPDSLLFGVQKPAAPASGGR